MTEVLASHTHSTSTFLMHWEGGGVCHVVVWANCASRSVAKIQKTTICARLATQLDGARVRQPDIPKHNLNYIKRGILSISRNKYAL